MELKAPLVQLSKPLLSSNSFLNQNFKTSARFAREFFVYFILQFRILVIPFVVFFMLLAFRSTRLSAFQHF